MCPKKLLVLLHYTGINLQHLDSGIKSKHNIRELSFLIISLFSLSWVSSAIATSLVVLGVRYDRSRRDVKINKVGFLSACGARARIVR
jgi:hypothetical protein